MGGTVLETYGDRCKLEGKLEGEHEGEHKANVKIAKKLLLMKMSIEDISKVTGFTMEEINTLH